MSEIEPAVQRATLGLPGLIRCRLTADGAAAEPPPPIELDIPAPVTIDELRARATELDAELVADDLDVAPDDRTPLAPVVPARLAEDAGASITVAAHRRAMVIDALERMAGLARQRLRRPWAHKASREDRVLEQLDAIAAAGSLEGALEWGAELRHDEGAMWALLFVLGSVDSIDALSLVLEWAPRVDAEVITAAASALAVSPLPRARELVAALRRADEPTARVIALELGIAKNLMEMDDAARSLDDPAALVRRAALRCLARWPQPAPRVVGRVLELLDDEPSAALESARALASWGDFRGLDRIRRPALGEGEWPEDAVEMFVISGVETDLEALEAWLRRRVTLPAHLDAIARFGHPGAWSFLVHHLDTLGLEDAAADALEVLFGPLVHAGHRGSGRHWEEAIAGQDFDVTTRYRNGVPWSPSVVATEIERGALSARAISRRVAELRGRMGHGAPGAPRLESWHLTAQPELETFLAAFRTHRPRSWG